MDKIEKSKNIIVIVLILGFLMALILKWRVIWFQLSQLDLTLGLETTFYWLLLIFWVSYIFMKKKSAFQTLRTAFLLTILIVPFHLVGFEPLSHFIARTAFVFWLIGLVQNLVELRQSESQNL